MSVSEVSFKPTIEINKTKEFQNINSIIIETLKTSRNSVINIVNNKETNKDDKIYLLQQENLKLLDAFSNLKDQIRELQNELNYQHYLSFSYKDHDLELDKLLIEKNIDYKRDPDTKNETYIHYYVNKKDWSKFIECADKLMNN